jgi:urease subunit alpha
VPAEIGARRPAFAVSVGRGLAKDDLVRNAASPPIEIDPRSGRVYLHGDELTCEPVTELPVNRSYLLT